MSGLRAPPLEDRARAVCVEMIGAGLGDKLGTLIVDGHDIIAEAMEALLNDVAQEVRGLAETDWVGKPVDLHRAVLAILQRHGAG